MAADAFAATFKAQFFCCGCFDGNKGNGSAYSPGNVGTHVINVGREFWGLGNNSDVSIVQKVAVFPCQFTGLPHFVYKNMLNKNSLSSHVLGFSLDIRIRNVFTWVIVYLDAF